MLQKDLNRIRPLPGAPNITPPCRNMEFEGPARAAPFTAIGGKTGQMWPVFDALCGINSFIINKHWSETQDKFVPFLPGGPGDPVQDWRLTRRHEQILLLHRCFDGLQFSSRVAPFALRGEFAIAAEMLAHLLP